MKSVLLFAVAIVSTLLVACGDTKSNNNNNTAVPSTPLATQYYYINQGLCYNDQNVRVDTSNCAGLSGYYEVNGYCYNPSNTRVGNEFCQTYPSRVRPSCLGNDYYTVRRGRHTPMDCRHRGCGGHNVFDRDGRGYYCRS